MTIFNRAEKTGDYTVISNQYLRDARLSLKARGVFSTILSLPDSWNLSAKGLSAILPDGLKSISTALKELEDRGYIVRRRLHGKKGYYTFEYIINECPDIPECQNRNIEKGVYDKGIVDKGDADKGIQSNTIESKTKQSSTHQSNPNQSTGALSSEEIDCDKPSQGVTADVMGLDERASIREIIRENIECDILIAQRSNREDGAQIGEMLELITTAYCSSKPTIRIGGEEMPISAVRSRFMQLDSGHIEYVLESMRANTTRVRNIKQYLLTALYNAPLTMDSSYRARVNHDMYGKGVGA